MSDERPPRGNVPIPDPTTLTTEALDREIGHLRGTLTQLIQERTKRFEGELDARDKAIAAALTTTKEAINKAEASHKEQVTSARAELKAEITALENRVDEMRNALAAGEVRAGILTGKGAGSQQTTTMFLTVGGLIVMVVGIIVGAIVGANF